MDTLTTKKTSKSTFAGMALAPALDNVGCFQGGWGQIKLGYRFLQGSSGRGPKVTQSSRCGSGYSCPVTAVSGCRMLKLVRYYLLTI